MQITEITASFSRTIQLEAYQPVNFHGSIKATVEEGEDIKEAYDELFGKVKKDIWDRAEKARYAAMGGKPEYNWDNFIELRDSGKLDGGKYTAEEIVNKLSDKYIVHEEWKNKFDEYLKTLESCYEPEPDAEHHENAGDRV